MQNLSAMLSVGLNHYLILGSLLFTIGLVGVLVRRNVIVILMSIELMLNAVNLIFIAFSKYSNNMQGQMMVFFVMTIAAAEAGVGLALAVMIYKKFNALHIRFFEHLKG